MDAALVRMIMRGIEAGDAEQFDSAERHDAIEWLQERVWLTRQDKNSQPVYQPRMSEAALEAASAVASYENGEAEKAKTHARRVLELMG